ncbi:MAG: type II toxin-antitoxin system VapC family toxin [Rhodobacteraceae bacterium]|nr:type II toxin-antitoxin system VapC family toxin [Paracoccaceae bacterium]
MIVIDTSALVAILSNEPERRLFNEIIEEAGSITISTANLLEARIVLYSRSGDHATLALDSFMLKSKMVVATISEALGDLAFQAYRRFGKGTGHPAALNYGDCFSYALARSLNAPLLFKGNDFIHTDVISAYTSQHR